MHTVIQPTTLFHRILLFLKILLGALVAVLVLGILVGHPAVRNVQSDAATPIAFAFLVGTVLYVRTKFVNCIFDGM
jgi:hypothetical protein